MVTMMLTEGATTITRERQRIRGRRGDFARPITFVVLPIRLFFPIHCRPDSSLAPSNGCIRSALIIIHPHYNTWYVDRAGRWNRRKYSQPWNPMTPVHIDCDAVRTLLLPCLKPRPCRHPCELLLIRHLGLHAKSLDSLVRCTTYWDFLFLLLSKKFKATYAQRSIQDRFFGSINLRTRGEKTHTHTFRLLSRYFR